MSEAVSAMVERVARAICASSNRNPDRIHAEAMGEHNVPEWRFSVDEAEAALEAMVEPTDDVIRAMEVQAENSCNHDRSWLPWYTDEIWAAGINTALGKPKLIRKAKAAGIPVVEAGEG